MLIGDNSIAAEVWLLSNRLNPEVNLEEIVSTRSIIGQYKKEANYINDDLMPYDIYKIAKGDKPGNKDAAIKAFEFFGRGIGDAIANLVTLIDGVIVIGGGIAGAQDLYMPALYEELTRSYKVNSGSTARPIQKVYNYSNKNDRDQFLKPTMVEVKVHQSDRVVYYDPNPRVVLAHSEIGASKAIQLGAYVYALNNL